MVAEEMVQTTSSPPEPAPVHEEPVLVHEEPVVSTQEPVIMEETVITKAEMSHVQSAPVVGTHKLEVWKAVFKSSVFVGVLTLLLIRF